MASTAASELARKALMNDARQEEAITVNQRALIDKILARYAAPADAAVPSFFPAQPDKWLKKEKQQMGCSGCSLNNKITQPRKAPHRIATSHFACRLS